MDMGRSPSTSRSRREKERADRKKRRERRSRERERERERREREREDTTAAGTSSGRAGGRTLRRRSPQPSRDDRSRDRGEQRSERSSRRRSRSRSYGFLTTPTTSARRRGGDTATATSSGLSEKAKISEADLEGKSPEEIEMLKTMGFCTFDTTKNKKVDGNDVGEVHVILKRKYRQYMNRKGGFNRPLDFVA